MPRSIAHTVTYALILTYCICVLVSNGNTAAGVVWVIISGRVRNTWRFGCVFQQLL